MKCHFSFMSVPGIKHPGKKMLLLGRKDLFSLQFEATVHHHVEIKAETWPATSIIKSRKRINVYMLTPQLIFFYSLQLST